MVILCDQPGLSGSTPHRDRKSQIRTSLSPPTAPLAAAEGARVLESEHPPFPRRLRVGNGVQPCTGVRRFKQFWNQDQPGKQRGYVYLQGRTKPQRVWVSQFICPLVLSSLGVCWRQHVPSLIDLVDQLHQNHSAGHLSCGIIQDRVDITLVVADQGNVQSASSCGLTIHSS